MQKWIFESVRLPSKQQVARRFIEQNFDEIDEMMDENGCSLLHIAADGNNLEIMQYIFNAYQQHSQKDNIKFNLKKKQEWINHKNSQGFTAIHFAVFRRNLKMVLLLEKKGADIYKVNNEGLNCLLLAAQGGSPLLMYYFMGKGSKIDFTDAKGNTALHWASYMAMDHAVEALIAWGSQIDRQDQTNGMTPLHLAVLSGSSRVVKKLLLGGCDRTIKSKTGQSAYDLAIERSYTQIASMIMDKMGLLSLLNLQSRFSKSSPRSFPFYFFIFLFLTTYLINIPYLIPFKDKDSSILVVVGMVIGVIVAVQFILLSVSNPGKIDSWSKDVYFQMLKQNHPSKICFYCNVVRPLRSRHCYICNMCVQVYDHHCPWIGNCVGSNNYFAFFMFLVSILIYMCYSIAYHITNLILLDGDRNQEMFVVLTVACCYNLFICCLFSLPVIYLLTVQIDNCHQDKTTYEKYSHRTNQNNTHLKELRKINRQTQLLDKKTLTISNPSIYGDVDSKQVDKNIVIEPTHWQNCYAMCFSNNTNALYKSVQSS